MHVYISYLCVCRGGGAFLSVTDFLPQALIALSVTDFSPQVLVCVG